jgi:hypothetical protein
VGVDITKVAAWPGQFIEQVVGDVRSRSPACTTHAERMEAGAVGRMVPSCTTCVEEITTVVDVDGAAPVPAAPLCPRGHSVERVMGSMRAISVVVHMDDVPMVSSTAGFVRIGWRRSRSRCWRRPCTEHGVSNRIQGHLDVPRGASQTQSLAPLLRPP